MKMSVPIRISPWILKAGITHVIISVQKTATSTDEIAAKENKSGFLIENNHIDQEYPFILIFISFTIYTFMYSFI